MTFTFRRELIAFWRVAKGVFLRDSDKITKGGASLALGFLAGAEEEGRGGAGASGGGA